MGDPTVANACVDQALATGLEPAAVQSRVIAPAMHFIGELWEDGALGIAEAHLATAVAWQALAHLYPRLLAGPDEGGERVLVGAVQGEYHLMGARMAADALEGAGYDVRFLGGDVRPPLLATWLEEHRPAAVALGLTMPLGNRNLVSQLKQIREFDPSIRLIVGGQGVSPLVRRSAGVAYAPDSERLVPVLRSALAQPVKADLPTKLAGGGVVFPELPLDFADAFSARHGVDSLEARMAQTAAAAAETTREQARRASRLERLACRDPLTELWNRRAFDDRYGEALSYGSSEQPALLLIDIDHFNDINQQFGSNAGDRALVQVARCIARALRPQDFAARYGDDEFAVLLGNTSAQEAVQIAERIRYQVETEVQDPTVRVSVGVTTAKPATRREAKASADRALEQAKRRGRNRVVYARTGAEAR